MNNVCHVVGKSKPDDDNNLDASSLDIGKFRALSFAIHIDTTGKRVIVPIDALTGEKIDGVRACAVASSVDGKTTMTLDLEIE
jgi:hypothetical protein